MSVAKLEDGNLGWQGFVPLGKFTTGWVPIGLENRVRPRLWNEFECHNSPVCGLPFVGSLGI